MKRRILSTLMALALALSLLPASALAVEATITADVPEVFTVDVPQEFSFTTHGTYSGDVNGSSDFSDDAAISKLEYYEVKDGKWHELPLGSDFGSSAGFPWRDGATSTFRVTFSKPGRYTFTASMKNASTGEAVCSTEKISFVVNAADAVAQVGAFSTPPWRRLWRRQRAAISLNF